MEDLLSSCRSSLSSLSPSFEQSPLGIALISNGEETTRGLMEAVDKLRRLKTDRFAGGGNQKFRPSFSLFNLWFDKCDF